MVGAGPDKVFCDTETVILNLFQHLNELHALNELKL